MRYISIADIIDLNKHLAEKGVPYVVHLRDACGKQSCWVEPGEGEIGGDATSGDDAHARLREELVAFLGSRGFSLEFDDETDNFWLAAK